MLVCCDLITVYVFLRIVMRLYVLLHVFYVFCTMYFSIEHLCAIDTRLINATCLLAILNFFEDGRPQQKQQQEQDE